VTTDVEVVIVGAGFGGLAAAASLRRAGVAGVRVLESAGTVGGTWRDNTYPGCACDVPAALYSLSFAQRSDWSRLYAAQPEILAHIQDAARRRRLLDHIDFGTAVRSATWHDASAHWILETSSGTTYRARFLVCAMGALRRAAIPTGGEAFAGPVFHSSAWRHDVDLTGKRVAVIGSGASAVQIVPAIVDRVHALHVFQRTPQWVLPRRDTPLSRRHQRLARWLPGYRRLVRAQIYWTLERRLGGVFRDVGQQAGLQRAAARHLERQVPDERLRRALTPDHAIGCKRLLMSNDWYPALTHPHTTVHAGTIRAVRPDAIVAADGTAVPIDVIVHATGFDVQNNITRIDVRGRDGVALAEHWQDGMQAYLGTAVAGFPNMFLITGPNSALAHNSQVFMIEAQARYVTGCIRRARRRRARTIEVRGDAQRAFNEWVQTRLAGTVWEDGGCTSWYHDHRTGRNTVLWPESATAFWRRTRRPRLAHYRLSADGTVGPPC
jgi:cation diffusion facilitator CzcD-associated flavoprotein CzcO